ncbi:hypothetical protein O7626_40000 [Micromonospora sp. WMMD1102]|uniref:hypothetical protein n=1 Tax=Micromonospora sp. WMMD1102 TaxID=3016105 RepID=UPI0024153FA1|nr:hypothetical protein [Micromonospora sp. WMMD1102]MDG4792000.1 hypothetical protein [Micromonospora sp. WMMD1102]
MAITPDTVQQVRALVTDVGGHVDGTVRILTEAWLRAWNELEPAWQAAVGEVVAVAAATSRWPSPWELARIDAIASAVVRTEQALALLAVEAGLVAGAAVAPVVAATTAAEPVLIASQLPAALAAAAAAEYAARVLPSALDVIVRRTSEQITSLTRPLSDEAQEAVRRALIRGIAVGDNPVVAARDMVRRVEGAFNGGLARAINVARTEMVGAYRETSRYIHEANADVLAGWIWWSALQPNTCPGCWSMHGREFPVDTSGPDDHQSGRCARLPKVKPWTELGIHDVDEPAGLTPDARARFAALPRAQQVAVMGRARLALLDAYPDLWDDLAVRRENPNWRPSYAVRPVRDLQAIARRRAA